jgi:predicted  nucleic acid-binding Zn-ribbon protein
MLNEKQELEPQAAALRTRREGQAVNVDRSILSLYDAIRARKGGVAVAHLERGMCGGCRITLPVSVMQRVRGGGGIVQCVSCERILLT